MPKADKKKKQETVSVCTSKDSTETLETDSFLCAVMFLTEKLDKGIVKAEPVKVTITQEFENEEGKLTYTVVSSTI